MSANYSEVVGVARDYYNSDDADHFYYEVWGGEDIHIGLYRNEFEPIAKASERTVETMANQIEKPLSGARIADLGAGYGGSARWLARQHDCRVSCINLSEVQNDRNREMNLRAGLEGKIDVLDASFEHVPLPDGSADVVWSQDSFLHSGNRVQVMSEIDRILEPGGEIIFTDPMQSDDCDSNLLKPVLDRLHLESLASIAFYRQQAQRLGWVELGVQDLTHHLVNHYTRVRQELAVRRSQLGDRVSDAYIDRMIAGLGHWIDAGDGGVLQWGILHFRRPSPV